VIHDPAAPDPHEPPFVAEVTHGWDRANRPVPTARVVVGHGLPAFAGEVGADAAGTVASLTAFVTANGVVGPSAAQVSAALGKPELLVRLRLLRLARRHWRGQPVLRVSETAAGLETFHPGPLVLGRRESFPPPAAANAAAPAVPGAVIAASRAAYARPREDVERELRSLHGWPHPDEIEEFAASQQKPPENLDERWAVERLAKEKVDYSLAIKLVREFGAERCLRQLRWLPYRKGIKNKARYIVGAIREEYPPPGNEGAMPVDE